MDILQATMSASPWAAEQQGYADQVAANQRVAQTVQLLQEARLKEQMQPLDMAFKQAMTDDYLARAKGTGYYDRTQEMADRNAERRAKADQLVQLAKDRKLRTTLEGIHGLNQMGQDVQPIIDNILPQLPEHVRSIFQPDQNINRYDRDAIETAIDALGAGDPEYNKNRRADRNLESLEARDRANRESRERMATDRNKALADIAKAKADKKPDELKKLAAYYRNLADNAKDDTERTHYEALYLRAFTDARELAAAPGVGTAQEKERQSNRFMEKHAGQQPSEQQPAQPSSNKAALKGVLGGGSAPPPPVNTPSATPLTPAGQNSSNPGSDPNYQRNPQSGTGTDYGKNEVAVLEDEYRAAIRSGNREAASILYNKLIQHPDFRGTSQLQSHPPAPAPSKAEPVTVAPTPSESPVASALMGTPKGNTISSQAFVDLAKTFDKTLVGGDIERAKQLVIVMNQLANSGSFSNPIFRRLLEEAKAKLRKVEQQANAPAVSHILGGD